MFLCIWAIGFKFRNFLAHSLRHFQGSSLHYSQSLPDCSQGWEPRLGVGEGTEHCRQPAATVGLSSSPAASHALVQDSCTCRYPDP